jgi:methylmalonyl-CoA carboxyltransferase small subunit
LKLQITVEGKIYEVEVEVLEEDGDMPAQSHGSYPPAGAVPYPMPVFGEQTAADDLWKNGDCERVCRSPITGLVIKVIVAPGQSVEKNDLLIVLEAMKMETNVTAPGAGIVKNITVAAGDSVKLHQVLVEFE